MYILVCGAVSAEVRAQILGGIRGLDTFERGWDITSDRITTVAAAMGDWLLDEANGALLVNSQQLAFSWERYKPGRFARYCNNCNMWRRRFIA